MALRYGTPSYYEYRGLWKSSPADADVTPAEYQEVYLAFSKWLDDRIADWDPLAKMPPCYFIGDFTYDRTQQMQFYDFGALTPQFVRSLQLLLQRREYVQWRIALGPGRPEDIIIVYPHAICASHELAPQSVDTVISETSERLVERDAQRELERQSRLDQLRPLLPEAYGRARASDRPILFKTEVNADGREGTVRMWILHPRNEGLLQVDGYSNSPRAYLCETQYVLPDGILLETSRDMPHNGLFLAAWEFEQTSDRVFTMERAGCVTKFEY